MKMMFYLVEICGKELEKYLHVVTADGKWYQATSYTSLVSEFIIIIIIIIIIISIIIIHRRL
jgi:hypothetical protein